MKCVNHFEFLTEETMKITGLGDVTAHRLEHEYDIPKNSAPLRPALKTAAYSLKIFVSAD
jgi:hypothetical protein